MLRRPQRKQSLLSNKTPFCLYPEQDTGELSLSSCVMCRRGSLPARWQVLGKGRALALGTPTCSQNRINTTHYPQRSSALVCSLFYPNRIITISACLANKRGAFWKKKKRSARKSKGKTKRDRERARTKRGRKKKHSKERKNRPACLAAQLPHDFDLRNR